VSVYAEVPPSLCPRLDGVAGKNAARFLLAFMFSVGTLQASPITFVGQTQLQNPTQVNTHGVTRGETKTPDFIEPATAPTPMIKWSLVHPGSVSCTIASTCSAPMEIPEPRSLLLVGTGFLAMAGLIRRRLSR
jgi:hypothetical protein